jgi:hypothetical protein
MGISFPSRPLPSRRVRLLAPLCGGSLTPKARGRRVCAGIRWAAVFVFLARAGGAGAARKTWLY